MLIPKELMDEFVSFLEYQLGTTPIIRPPDFNEVGRVIWGETFFQFKKLGDSIEVIGPTKRREELELRWNSHVVALYQSEISEEYDAGSMDQSDNE